MSIKPKILLLFIIFTFHTNLISEIRIKSLFSDFENNYHFVQSSSIRKVYVLNNDWKVFTNENPEKKIKTSIPCTFEGASSLIFQKKIYFSKNDIQNHILKLYFLGINNSVEISINNYTIFKKIGAEVPFEVDLPEDILKPEANNLITLKVISNLDSETTIPLKCGFLFPKYSAGIIRDLFIEFLPKTFIEDLNFHFVYSENQKKVYATADVRIKNLQLLSQEASDIKLEFSLIPNIGTQTQNFVFSINDKIELTRKYNFIIENPVLWSPELPNFYKVKISLYNGNQLIDEITREVCIYNLNTKNNLLLNDQPFSFAGTTYYLNESELSTSTYQKIYNDLSLIKKTGFNSVRFAKAFPHPYALYLCQKLGLFAFIELPLNSVPEEILSQDEFQIRTQNRFKDFVTQYKKFSNSTIFGLGSSLLPNSYSTKKFIDGLLKNINEDIITYASFVGLPSPDFYNLNLIGLELYSHPIDSLSALNNLERNKYFISEVNYPDYFGSSSGYLVKNSTEAQAKYYEKFLSLISNSKLNGFFINTLFNYKGNYKSLYGGDIIYKLGLIKSGQNLNTLSYKVIDAFLNKKQNVTIPIGASKTESKLFFIFIALGLSLILAVLINSSKKFKEDCTRALFRTYNFFSDLRDNRILSGIPSIILLLIEIGSISLLFTIILFYLRTNLLLEKILLSFGEEWLINLVSFLAWNPEYCFIFMYLFFLIKIFIISIIIKLFSTSIQTKVRITNIFFNVIWALLPLTLLLPAELILYRILMIENFNIYIIITIIITLIWIYLRILKGTYILFEVNRLKVYFYGISLILIFAGIVILYYHFTNSTIYYISNSIKQYNLMLR
ncbi:MAG: hypothetical protein N2249_07045 [Melioribacter sp.]|nr:hypothetical protein [Melioribacter sp.]